jgi:hypothetical protein
MSNCLVKKEVRINEHVGFFCESLAYLELELRLWVYKSFLFSF